MRAPALALSLVLAAVACGGKSSPPPAAPSNQPATAPAPTPDPAPAPPAAPASSSDPAFEAMMGRALSLFDAMGAAADQAAGDCNRLSDGLELAMNDHHDFLTEAKRYKNDPEMEQRAEAWMKVHTDEMMAPMMKLAGAAQKCIGTPKFDATMKRLQELGN